MASSSQFKPIGSKRAKGPQGDSFASARGYDLGYDHEDYDFDVRSNSHLPFPSTFSRSHRRGGMQM